MRWPAVPEGGIRDSAQLPQLQPTAYLVFVSLHAVFIHANVSWRFPRVVEALIVTPRFHHWHHGAEAAALDKNFAVHLPWIDKLFGTYHCPQGQW
ncbi:MAG: sterol desaturase family protein, partial [Gemmatimonadota bacterium]|nr:sterol desaturase family protein [Gemmatimonadota bacterium]